MKERYQHQNTRTKIYRRVRYFPAFVLHLLLDIILWLVFGAPKLETLMFTGDEKSIETITKLPEKRRKLLFGRLAALKSIYTMNVSSYHMKMKNYVTMNELLEDIKNGGN